MAGFNTSDVGQYGQVGLPTDGRGNDGSGFGEGGDIRPPPPEYRRPVYHDFSDTGSMSGGGATDESACDTVVVVSGRTQLRTRVWEERTGELEAEGERDDDVDMVDVGWRGSAE